MAAVSWEGFDLELERLTTRMTSTEDKLKTVDCSMPDSLQEAANNLKHFKVKLL